MTQHLSAAPPNLPMKDLALKGHEARHFKFEVADATAIDYPQSPRAQKPSDVRVLRRTTRFVPLVFKRGRRQSRHHHWRRR